MKRSAFLCSLLFFARIFSLQGTESSTSLSETQRVEITFEALSRIQSDIKTDDALRSAVYNFLERVRGTSQFVQIVKKFKIKDQDEGLVEVAVKLPSDESGVEAIRMVLANENFDLLKKSLADTNGSVAIKTAEALGNAKEQKATPLLLPLISEAKRDSLLRKAAIRALVQTQDGASDVLKLAKEDKLPADSKLTAATELNGVRWEKIKTEAAKILPLPQGHDSEMLPAIADLEKMKGDIANGEKVFFREKTACATCHKVKDRGADIGPSLTEIGNKLGKDALFEAILDPSAGISFGFEAHQIELKSGDEAYGLLVSETENEIVVKDLKGIVTPYKKSDVAKQQQLKTSIMPTGLQATMTTEELVDLVEFLSSLKKAGN